MHHRGIHSFGCRRSSWALCLGHHVSSAFSHRLRKYRRHVQHEAACLADVYVGLRYDCGPSPWPNIWDIHICDSWMVGDLGIKTDDKWC